MNTKIRKSITISEDVFNRINNYAKSKNESFSAFLCNTAITEIERQEEMSLCDYIIENCEFVSDEEQEEFEKLNLDFSDEGEEIWLDELLQS